MSELSDLYQETILEHNKNPRNFREIADASKKALGNNPLCGDALQVYVSMDDDTITDVAFKGSGCAISKASASMMTQAVKGKTRAEAESIFGEFHDMVTGKLDNRNGREPFRQAQNIFRCARISGARKMREP
jgi:nitrogen fixation NifU-like protein